MENKIKFSPEQLSAIKSEQTRLLVSASAGSGKTKVLVERIADIVSTKKANISQMLVVTFTNLASLEMKSRLKKTLENLAKTDEYYYEQLNLLNTANISTLHKFCQNVIREFFYEVQVDPNFAVLDESEATFLKQKALEQVISDYAKSSDVEFEKIYQIFFENRNDDALKQNILSIYSFLSSKDDEYFERMIDTSYNGDIEKNTVINYIKNELDEMLDFYINHFNECLVSAKQINSENVAEIISSHISILKAIKNCDFYDVQSTIQATKFSTKKIKEATVEEQMLLDDISATIDEVKKQLTKISPCFVSSKSILETELDANKKVLEKFYEIVKNFGYAYSNLKLQKNSLDFDDLEHFCLKILKNSKIKEQLQNRFKYIFIDEYQDTNEIQESIIGQLTNNNFVFMVGDVKQSIYMFRQCNPQIFVNKMELLKSQNKDNVINLNANFRSDKDILNFSNLVFENIMRKDTACLDYKADSKFIFGETVEKQQTNISSVNLCLIQKQAKKESEQSPKNVYSILDDKLSKDEDLAIQKEAKLIFEKIVELKNTQLKENGKIRDIEFSDMAVLVRTREAIKQISQVLTMLGVPVNAEYNTNLFEEKEIKVLIDYLKILNNYYDDIALSGVLKSPIMELTDIDLVMIRQAYLDVPFYEAVKCYAEEQSDELSKKLKKLFSDLKHFASLLLYRTPSELIVDIIGFYNLEQYYSKHSNFLQILTNYDLFVNEIKNIGSDNLSQLISYIDSFANSTQDVNIKTSANSVYVGTIHSSKGLEYPVVFLADTAKKFSTISLKEKLVKNGEFGFAISNYDVAKRQKREGVIKNIIKRRISQQEKQEEMRMLYVALTRAKSYLFVIGSCELSALKPITQTFQIKQSNSYLDYITGSLEPYTLNNLQQENTSQICHYNNLDFKIETYSPNFDDNLISLKNNQAFEPKLDNEYLSKTFETNNFAFKNTVTAILEQQEDYNITDFKIKNSGVHNDEDFLLIGTNYHKIMETIDFSAQSVKSEISTKLENGLLKPADLELVDLNRIEKAVENINKIIGEQDVILKEKPFMTYMPLDYAVKNGSDEKVLVQGVVDLMIIKPSEIVLIDYKTSRLKTHQAFKDRYSLQLELYKQAIEKFYKKPVTKKYIYSFYLNELIIVWQMQNINIIILYRYWECFLITFARSKNYGRNF